MNGTKVAMDRAGRIVLPKRIRDALGLEPGVELDLTKAQPAVGGIDLLLKCVMAGGDVRVPAHWRLYWESRGAGGVTVKGGLTATDPASADLRLDLSAVAGGVTIHEV